MSVEKSAHAVWFNPALTAAMNFLKKNLALIAF